MLSYALLGGFTRRRARGPADGGPTRRRRDDCALAAIAAAVAIAGGIVVDFGTFGDEGVRVTAEIEADALAAFGVALEKEGVHLFDASRAEIESARGRRPVVALVHVAFA